MARATIETKTLVDTLKAAGRATGKGLPILQLARFQSKDDVLTVTSTNLDVTISTQVEAKTDGEFDVLLDPKHLASVAKRSKAEALVIQPEENHWATIIGEAGMSARVTGANPEDYPAIFDSDNVRMQEVEGLSLAELIERTAFSISDDEARYNLCGALMQADGEKLTMVSTDGHRLSKAQAPCEMVLQSDMIVPAQALSLVLSQLDRTKTIAIGCQQSTAVFVQGNWTISARLIEGTFPDFTAILPDPSPEARATFDRAELVDAIQFARLFADDKTSDIRFSLDANECELYASNADTGEASKSIRCEYRGEPVKIRYNAKYLLDSLAAVDTGDVHLEARDNLSPTSITQPGDDDALWIVMPMRL